MPQFIVEPDAVDLAAASAIVEGAEARHLKGVLRATPGDRVLLTDGRGRRWQGVYTADGGSWVRVEQLREIPSNEPDLQLELLQGLPKGERWELILEKVTELGATGIRPLYTQYSVARVPEARLGRKVERWRDKVRAAVKQCERGALPVVYVPVDLGRCLADLPTATAWEKRLYLAERSGDREDLTVSTGGVRSIRLAVGPEGGWSEGERSELERAGFQPLSLGPRILRCDTAAIVGLALVLHGSQILVSEPARW